MEFASSDQALNDTQVFFALLQATGLQAIALGRKIQHLHLGLAAIDEDKVLATERILLELVADQGAQPPERFAQVRGLRA
tara:strand:- start:13064 stop:13303 length:240 start_codon:yes stop_codon:yes gene_type:complete